MKHFVFYQTQRTRSLCVHQIIQITATSLKKISFLFTLPMSIGQLPSMWTMDLDDGVNPIGRGGGPAWRGMAYAIPCVYHVYLLLLVLLLVSILLLVEKVFRLSK
jgi:hypothetical protein